MSDEQIDDLFGALQAGLGAAVRQVVRFDWHRPALGLLLRRLRKRVLAAVGQSQS